METTPTAWSLQMLKDFRDMCVYGLGGVPCTLIGKHSSITCSQQTSKQWVSYCGFVPRRDLEFVPFEIHEVDSMEEYPSHMGYLEIKNRPALQISNDEPPTQPAAAVIYCGLKKGTRVFEVLDRAVTESRMFNSQTELRFSLDNAPLKDLRVEEVLDKKLPIRSVEVEPGYVSCGDTWLEKRKSHSSVANRQGTPLRTIISYIWSIIVNIVCLILAAHLFTLMTTKAEAILLAVLILLYVQVRFSQVGASEVFLKGQKQFRHLLKLLGDPLLQDQDVMEELEEEDNALRKTKINTYITLGFLSILFFIALWEIISAIGFI